MMSIVVSSSGDVSVLLYQLIHPQKIYSDAKQDFGELRLGLMQNCVIASHQLPRR